MRVLLSALALVAVGSVYAVQQAQEATIHVRLDTKRGTDAAVPDWDAPTTSAPTQQHWADLPATEALTCRRVQDETGFRDIIASACATRDAGGYSFYYQTTTNRLLRNCNCSSYSGGVDGVDLGSEVGRLPNVRCFAKNATRTFADVAALFNQTGVKCHSSEFVYR